jgi:hypothetical protein
MMQTPMEQIAFADCLRQLAAMAGEI